jgi:hypothetical protein
MLGAGIEPPILILDLCKLVCPSDLAVTQISSGNMFGSSSVNDATYFISVPLLWSKVHGKVNTLSWELEQIVPCLSSSIDLEEQVRRRLVTLVRYNTESTEQVPNRWSVFYRRYHNSASDRRAKRIREHIYTLACQKLKLKYMDKIRDNRWSIAWKFPNHFCHVPPIRIYSERLSHSFIEC